MKLAILLVLVTSMKMDLLMMDVGTYWSSRGNVVNRGMETSRE